MSYVIGGGVFFLKKGKNLKFYSLPPNRAGSHWGYRAVLMAGAILGGLERLHRFFRQCQEECSQNN